MILQPAPFFELIFSLQEKSEYSQTHPSSSGSHSSMLAQFSLFNTLSFKV